MNRQERIEKLLIGELSNAEIEGNIERTASSLAKEVVLRDEVVVDIESAYSDIVRVTGDQPMSKAIAEGLTPDIISFKGDK